jgi:hypothetical protein
MTSKEKLQDTRKMGTLRPNASYIYESPDGGKTVYAREVGEPLSKRKLVGYQIDLFEDVNWYEVSLKARMNPTLQKALERAILIYQTIKDE